jgi:hypothetical protein
MNAVVDLYELSRCSWEQETSSSQKSEEPLTVTRGLLLPVSPLIRIECDERLNHHTVLPWERAWPLVGVAAPGCGACLCRASSTRRTELQARCPVV